MELDCTVAYLMLSGTSFNGLEFWSNFLHPANYFVTCCVKRTRPDVVYLVGQATGSDETLHGPHTRLPPQYLTEVPESGGEVTDPCAVCAGKRENPAGTCRASFRKVFLIEYHPLHGGCFGVGGTPCEELVPYLGFNLVQFDGAHSRLTLSGRL